MPNAPVPAAATGLLGLNFASRTFPRTKLATMSMHDLAQLSQLLWTVQGAITQSAIINQPGPATLARQMLQDLSGEVVGALSDIASVAEAHRPASVAEARWRGWLLMSSAAQFCDDLGDMAVTATNAAADERALTLPRH